MGYPCSLLSSNIIADQFNVGIVPRDFRGDGQNVYRRRMVGLCSGGAASESLSGLPSKLKVKGAINASQQTPIRSMFEGVKKSK